MAYSSGARALAALFTVILAISFFGCGGGGGTTSGGSTTPDLILREAVEDPDANSTVGGTLFSLLNGIIDYPYNAAVTLTGTPDKGGVYSDSTVSSMRGSYRFTDVPPGLYTVTATAQSSTIDDLTLTATVANVRVRGNIPAMMVNLLLGQASEMITFTGLIMRSSDSTPVAGATVTVDVNGFTTDHLQGGSDAKVSALICTTTGADGRYRLEVPISGSTYYVAAHGDFSMVSESPVLENLPAGEKEVNLVLDNAITPVFAPLQLDMLSATLPAPTAAAGQQALVTRLAVACALNAPADRLTRLETRARTRAASTTRSVGWVENDLYWAVLDGDVGVRGFHIYRATDKEGPYTYAGSVNDPYLLFFFDSDPKLQILPRTYYVVTSFAANGKTSSPSRPFQAEPLSQIETTGPADGATIPKAGAQVTWNAVEGAKSYLVTIFYNAPPSFNMLPIRTPAVYTNGQTSESFADLPPGNYWWSVSAYNTTDPNWATAASYSAYRKVTIE